MQRSSPPQQSEEKRHETADRVPAEGADCLLRDDFELAVIVAMITVGVVQLSIDEVIGVVAMRNRFMTTARTMPVAGIVSADLASLRASIWVRSRNLDHMFVNMVLMRVMEMTVVKIIAMVTVLYGHVATARTVDMGMVRMNRVMRRHGDQLPESNDANNNAAADQKCH